MDKFTQFTLEELVTKKFVDLNGLDYFWGQAKEYIDAQDAANGGDITSVSEALTKALNDAVAKLEGDITTAAETAATNLSNAVSTLENTISTNAQTAADATQAVADDLAEHVVATDTYTWGEGDDASSVTSSIHITAQERKEWNDAKSAIDTFLKDADMTTNAVDTLKELQDYMDSDGSAAAALVDRVAALEAADIAMDAAYKAADEVVLSSAKAYTDELRLALTIASNDDIDTIFATADPEA